MATKTKSNTEQLQTELKQTADSAVSFAKNTAEAVQKDVQARAADVRDTAQQVFLAGLGAFAMAEEEGSKLFKQLVKKGEKIEKRLPSLPSLPSLPALPTMGKLRSQLDVSSTRVGLAVKERVGDAQYMANEAAEQVEDRMQEAVAVVMKKVGVPTRDEIAELTASVERLTQHIDRMKRERAQTEAELAQTQAELERAQAQAKRARAQAKEARAEVQEAREEVEEARAEAADARAEVTYEAVGGGWYELKVGGVVVEKVQGREDAEAAVARLQEEQA